MPRVIVTGATGFLGGCVGKSLLERGYEVHGLARTPPAAPGAVHWHGVDLLDPAASAAVLREVRAEGMVHVAWETTPGAYWTSAANLDWIAATVGLLRVFREAGGRRLVMAGSSAEYRWGADAVLDDEATPLAPASLYGRCRNAMREIVEAWAPGAGLSWAWGRVFNLFGPGEDSRRLIPRVIRTLQRKDALPFDAGERVRDFLHVGDAGEAFAALYASPLQGALNVASGRGVTIRDVVSRIAGELDAAHLVSFGATAPPAGEPQSVVGSVRRLREELGWKPRAGLEERLAQTVDWWRRQEPAPKAR